MTNRNKQVAQEILKGISMLIAELNFQQDYGMITVTDVIVTTGLEKATIFVSAIQHGRAAARELNKKSAYIKQELGKIIQLRKIPQLTFEFDISNERTDQIEKLLNDK